MPSKAPTPTPAPKRKPSPKAGTYKPKIRAITPRTPAEVPFLVSVKPGSKTAVLAAMQSLGYKVKAERVPMGINTIAVTVPHTIGLQVTKAPSVSKAGVAAVTQTALAALKNIPGGWASQVGTQAGRVGVRCCPLAAVPPAACQLRAAACRRLPRC